MLMILFIVGCCFIVQGTRAMVMNTAAVKMSAAINRRLIIVPLLVVVVLS